VPETVNRGRPARSPGKWRGSHDASSPTSARSGQISNLFAADFANGGCGGGLPGDVRRQRPRADGTDLHARHRGNTRARGSAHDSDADHTVVQDHPGGGPVPEGFAVDVSNFANPQGITVPVSVSLGSNPDNGATHIEPGAFTQGLLSVNLHVKQFPAPGKFTGQVIVTIPGTAAAAGAPAVPAQSTLWRFVLTSASEVRPATLVVDQNAVTVTGARAFCLPWVGWCLGQDDPLVASVHLRDKTGNWPLTGVIARLESGLKTPGTNFDASSQLAVKFNGQQVPDFFSASTSPTTKSSSQPIASTTGERMIAAREQATATLTFTPGEVGEYTIPLRFTAANSADDDLQKLTVTLLVRNSIFPAILTLLVAAAVSFAATRVVSMLRQRAAIQARLRTLRPAWLDNERPILPVIWLRATLRLADNLSRRFWLLGSSEIDPRLSAAAAMLATLDQVRQTRNRIQTIPQPMVRQRAIWKLDEVVGQLGAAPLSNQDVASFKTQLDKFDQWCDPAKRENVYWEDLLPSIQSICAEVAGVAIPDDRRALATQLMQALEEAETGAATLDQKTTAEESYQRLAILLELCRRGHFELTGGLGNTVPIETVRAVVDNAWWALLKNPDTTLTIQAPSATLDPPEAFDSVTYRVDTPSQPFLSDTYLMRKKLSYVWTIEIWSADRWWRNAKQIGRLQVTSTQPQIAQYSPRAGSMRASVKISYQGDAGPEISAAPVVVTSSSDFGILAKYERADLIGFALAAVVSLASGIALYVLKPTFVGSLQDYLTLFTWGASIDQGKNFLQSLGAYAATTSKPASQGAGGG
jgi:hypothetical protein